MKQLSKALFLGASLCAATLTVCAEETAKPQVATVDFEAFRTSAYCPTTLENVRNGRIIYAVKGEDLPAAYLMFRGAVGDKVRMDVVTATDVFTACRNGDSFWGYDKNNGRVTLSAEDAAEMKIDTTFFPFPFKKNTVYGPLTPAGSGIFSTSECVVFETKPLENATFTLSVWMDKETKRLCLISSEDEQGVFSTSFRNYKDFGGVELPTRINLSSPDGVTTLILKSAEWNVEFAEGIFEKTGSLDRDPRVKELQKYLASVDARKAAVKDAADAAAAEKAKADQEAAEKRIAARKAAKDEKHIEDLKKEIARLDGEIEEKTGKLSALEEYIRANIEGSMETAKEYARRPYRYRRTWSRYGWSSWSTKTNTAQRRLAKKFYKEAEASGKEYDKIAQELTSLRLQRAEAQAQLEKIEGAAAPQDTKAVK